MPEPFASAAFALGKGAISQPVISMFGVHLIRCTQEKPGTKTLKDDEVNEEVSRPERIKRFRIVRGYFTVGDQLTPTQKTRRQLVLAQFADEVEALYAEEG